MTLRFFYRTPNAFLLLILLLVAACKRERMSIVVQDVSLSQSIPLRKITKGDNGIFVVGGERWTRAYIARIDSFETVQQVDLSWNNIQNGLYGIDAFKNKIVAVGYGGSVYFSRDNGTNWNYLKQVGSDELQQVSLADTVYLRAVGGISFKKGVLTTMDYIGVENKQLSQERNFELSDIEMLDSISGYMSGYGALMKTTNGGSTWDFTSARGDYFKAMAWKNTQEGIVVGYNGSLLKTMNGGGTWDRIRNGNSAWKKKLRFNDIATDGFSTYVAVGEEGLCYISQDDGSTWTQAETFTNEHLYGVCFDSERQWFVVGENGALFKIKL